MQSSLHISARDALLWVWGPSCEVLFLFVLIWSTLQGRVCTRNLITSKHVLYVLSLMTTQCFCLGFTSSVCENCHVPKVASAARGGLVCPLCSDRRPGQGLGESDKTKGVVKDKEKNKRMKGQSSHATWKSETEMQLRQHYD